MDPFDFDPLRRIDPLARFNRRFPLMQGGGGGATRTRPEYNTPLPEEQQSSLGQQLLDTASSGLSQVAGALDKPGQVVRGLIAGHGPSAFKHLIPFSGSLGITKPEEYVSGRDITNQLGLTTKGAKDWGSWGLGLAADIATDPLTFASLGPKTALTSTGRALERAGQLKGLSREGLLKGFETTAPELAQAGKSASDIAYEAAKGTRVASPEAVALGARPGEALSGLARFSVPFFPKAGFTVGTGPGAQEVARGLDVASDYLRYGNPVGRTLGALFNADVNRATSGAVQRGMARYYTPALRELQQAGRGQTYDVLAGLDPLIRAKQFSEPEITGAVRSLAEQVNPQLAPALEAAARPTSETVRDIGARALVQARAAGADIRDVSDPFAKYVHRQGLDVAEEGGRVLGTSKAFTGKTASDIRRQELFRNVPGGTEYINSLTRFGGTQDVKGAAATIRQELQQNFERGGFDPNMTLATKRGGELVDMPVGEYLDRKSRQLAKYAAGLEPGRTGIFSPNIAEDVQRYGEMQARKVAAARGAIGTIGDVARPKQEGDVAVPELLKRLGLRTYGEEGQAAQGALVQAQTALAKKGAADVAPMVGDLKAIHREVNRFGVPSDIADEMTKSMQGWATPEELKEPGNLWSQATNLYKALLYPIWPSAHVRNLTTAAINNLRSGVTPLDYATQIGILRGTVSPDRLARYGFRNLDEARRAQYAAANILGGHSLAEDVSNVAATTAGQPAGRFTPLVPGSERAGRFGLAADVGSVLGRGVVGSLAAGAKGAGQGIANLLNRGRTWGQSLGENLAIKGVGGAERDILPAVLAGRVASTNIEDTVRGAQFLAEVRKGATPAQAAEMVNKTHFDYSRLSPLERNVIRPVVPFYTYSRFNLPAQLQTALTRPGIISAQLKPFTQDQGQYVPEYLRGGVALPLGPETGGQQQYLSSLGLPAEEAFGRFHFRGALPDVRQTAMDFLGMLHPIPKGALEQLADTQFYSGRRLSDLRAPESARAVGRLFGEENPQLLAQLMVNTPASRFITSFDKLFDPRKAWYQKALNLGTGARISDVDVEKTRSIELRNRLEEMLRGQPHLSRYQRFYVKPEEAANLTPREIELMRLYAGAQQDAQEAARRRKESSAVPP